MRLLAATVLLLSLAAPGAAGAAPGDLDPSFGGGAGWVRTLEVRDASNNYLPQGAEDVAVQPDGRIVVTGSVIDGRSNRYFGALRYMPDARSTARSAPAGSSRSTSGASRTRARSRCSATARSSSRGRRTARRRAASRRCG